MFVPDGGALPGCPYEHIGSAEFHPDADGAAWLTATAEGDAMPRGHDAGINGSSNMSAGSAVMPTVGLMAQETEQMRSPAHEAAPGRPTATGSNAHRSSQEPEGQEAFPGSVTVVLPDGQTVPDPFTGSQLKSPVADLAPVAVAGRQVGNAFRAMLQNPDTTAGAGIYLATSLGIYLGHGGWFDYQREGNHITGFTPLPQYRNISKFNVGLFCQQAGLSLDESLRIAGGYQSLFR
jgi:hypothetical protein